jgi:hypothetical protein
MKRELPKKGELWFNKGLGVLKISFDASPEDRFAVAEVLTSESSWVQVSPSLRKDFENDLSESWVGIIEKPVDALLAWASGWKTGAGVKNHDSKYTDMPRDNTLRKVYEIGFKEGTPAFKLAKEEFADHCGIKGA